MSAPGSSYSYLEDCLRRNVLFLTGKGGVGKTTLAWATARLLQKQRKKVAVVHWTPLEDEITGPFRFDEGGLPAIDAIAVDTLEAFREYALRILKFEKIYEVAFNNHIFKTFIRAAPGIGETVVAGKIWDLSQRGGYDLIVVDLPSSGHAVSFFKSPRGVHHLFRTGFVHRDAEKILGMFSAPSTRLDLVTLPEELPVTECLQLKQSLDALGEFPYGFLHLNRCSPDFHLPETTSHFPPEIQNWCLRYQARKKEEAENQSPLKQLRMRLLPQIHRPPSRPEVLIDTLAEALAHT